MGVSAPHPSQRRFSCDVCRKSKSRCQRIKPTDEKCARCTMMGLQCAIGQQKVPGRPRRKQAAKASAPTYHAEKSTLPPSPIPLQQKPFSTDEWSPFDWTGMLYPSPFTPGMPSQKMQDENPASWGMGFIDVFHQSNSSWTTSDDMEYINTPFSTDINAITNIYTDMSPGPTLPLAVNNDFSVLGNCLNTQHPRITESGDSMTDLSTINLGLHVRLEAIKKNKKTLNFDMMVDQQGPLFIDNITLADYIIKVSQEFLFILIKLYDTQHCPELLCDSQPMELLCPCHLSSQFLKQAKNLFQVSLPQPTVTSEPLPTAMTLMITSVFIQLFTIYELILNHITTRVERIVVERVEFAPTVIVCGRQLETPCTYGVIFCEVSVSLTESIECVLGVGRMKEGKEVGLLSPRQVTVLGDELNERRRVIPDHAMMTPTTLRKLFGKVADILRNIRS